MSKVHEFLDTYRNLEEALKVLYSGKKLRYSSLVLEYMNSNGKKYYDELDLCRELRNLLSHHADISGKPPVEPSDELIASLKKIIWDIENPVTALSMATPVSKLAVAKQGDNVASLLNEMRERGYSHVPVFRSEKLFGVFSIDAVFRYMRDNLYATPEKLRIADIDKYLVPESHMFEKYEFTKADTPYSQIADIFRAQGPGSVRVAAVFVTETGTKNSRVIGMITPWDVIKSER